MRHLIKRIDDITLCPTRLIALCKLHYEKARKKIKYYNKHAHHTIIHRRALTKILYIHQVYTYTHMYTEMEEGIAAVERNKRIPNPEEKIK